MAMFILTGIFVISLAASELVNNGLILGKTQVNSTKAYFAAEAGAERILSGIRSFPSEFDLELCADDKCFSFDSGDGSIDSCDAVCDIADLNVARKLSNDSYYIIKYNENGNNVRFKSTGSFQDVSRAVQIGFSLVPETCDDITDNDEDGDGLINCEDTISCNGKVGGPSGELCESPENTCDDNFDNDRNGFTDCDDISCDGQPGPGAGNCIYAP